MGSNDRGSGFLAGLIFGGIIGAAIGFFLSQKSSKDTLKAKLKDLVAQGRESIRVKSFFKNR